MASRTPPSVGGEYDQFEAAFKAARIPVELYEALGDVWVESPARAHHLIARFKDTGELPIRQKAASPGDEFDQLGAQIAAAARAQAMQPGGDRTAIAQQLRAVLTQLTTPQKATKAAAPNLGDIINTALSTMKEVH